MVVRMRHTRAHTAKRRSHHALKDANILLCPNCSATTRPHQVCVKCGYYKGKLLIKVATKKDKKEIVQKDSKDN
ncbi:MAG: 50S ribosomal protein L32 [Cyanobium sp. MAG06]|nr:50S ribosomal protein L32 [Cyanobium sp. MAG06]